MTEQEKFNEAEILERGLAQKLFGKLNIATYELSDVGSKALFDGFWFEGTVQVWFEAKVRDRDYSAEGFIIEKQKIRTFYDCYKAGSGLQYIVFYPEPEYLWYNCVMFDINYRIKLWIEEGAPWEMLNFPKTTMGDQTLIEKKVIKLFPSKWDKIIYEL